MLTRLIAKNFKGLKEIDIDLSQNVVLIGPNNSGKTSALQALSLWDIGLKTWLSKRGSDQSESKRSGVTINRRDLIALPMPNALLLWNDLHVKSTPLIDGKRKTVDVFIDIIVEGVSSKNKLWKCGFEFYYANPESIYCRPIRIDKKNGDRMPLPDEEVLNEVHVALLPPMSGLASVEPRSEQGRINVLIGEGQTAQVLRNLCLTIYEQGEKWKDICSEMKDLFGVSLQNPVYIPARGEVAMAFKTNNNVELDISAAGRGLQQTLLILSFLYANPNTVLLIDEPDAHLEILRQRQIYKLLSDEVRCAGCQLICASHSEVVLDEAAEKDTVVAFVGRPHIINDKQQVLKSLREIGFQDYYLAEEKGWVLYLEGSTDLSILRSFAKTLGHPAYDLLEMPFAKYLGNIIPTDADRHYYALREAYADLLGVAVFDRVSNPLNSTDNFVKVMWRKREIENYLCQRDVILKYIRGGQPADLFISHQMQTMNDCMDELEKALQTVGKPDPWSDDIKATDDFLDPLFKNYYAKIGLPTKSMRKRKYHELAELVPKGELDEEIAEKLDLIFDIAKKAKPRKQ